jgi:hypothetical protein
MLHRFFYRSNTDVSFAAQGLPVRIVPNCATPFKHADRRRAFGAASNIAERRAHWQQHGAGR